MTDTAASPALHGDHLAPLAPSRPPLTAVRRVGILYQTKRLEVIALAREVEQFLRARDVEVIAGAITLEEQIVCQELDLFVTIGGDGTMLRAAHCAARWRTPLLGINMGRLGFLTECGPADWQATLSAVLRHDWWLEQRCMLSTQLDGVEGTTEALNDVVLARGARPRAIHVDLAIDGVRVDELVADAVIVATPTGSTAYAMAAGGPVLDPRMEGLAFVPVAAHLSVPGPMVLPSSSRISLRSTRDISAVLSVDGQIDLPVSMGQTVEIRASRLRCLFARTRPPEVFYGTLVTRLRRK